MALVCDNKSEEAKAEDPTENEDLEDGEIEDDGDEEIPNETPIEPPKVDTPPAKDTKIPEQKYRDEKERGEKKRHDKKQHLTEAEKSVMRLHKLERIEREKREKYRREQGQIPVHPIDVEEDFAKSLEKAIAQVLKKDKPPSEDETIVEEKRGKKRKKKDKHKKQKKIKQQESPKLEEIDENEMLNVRGGSPEPKEVKERNSPVLKSEDESYDSEYSSEPSSESREGVREGRKRKHGKKNFERNRDRKFRDRSRERSRDREKRQKGLPSKRNTGICLYFLQGLCEDENCPYSHESVQPMKLELCKFYLLDCCAKGDKCLYMHQDFPCKYYHTGIPCPYNEKCKFAHGGPLSDGLKQILFKHIETAPKEILGNFPRLSRENANVMILQAQKNLESKFPQNKKDDNNGASNIKSDAPSPFDGSTNMMQEGGGHISDNSDGSGKKENKRSRPSRWQDPDPIEKEKKNISATMTHPFGGLKSGFKDQDMRINSNGDIDMRTLPPPMSQPMIHTTNIVNPKILAQQPPPIINQNPLIQSNLILPNLLPSLLQQSSNPSLQTVLNSAAAAGLLNQNLLGPPPFNTIAGPSDPNPLDIEKYKMEAAGLTNIDIEAARKDVDNRTINDFSNKDTDIRQFNKNIMSPDDEERESGLQIVMEEEDQKTDDATKTDSILQSLPKTQRELFKRIQAHQKDNVLTESKSPSDNEDANIDWYSDDEDDNKLTIKDDFDDPKQEVSETEPSPVKPSDMMDKLGDLSKIDISAEVTKLLSSIKQTASSTPPREEVVKDEVIRDPRRPTDPRKARNSIEEKPLSIYEQGSITEVSKDIDLRNSEGMKDLDYRSGGRPDVDLRQLGLPFKGMQNYTPATEIDASINSHPPMVWKVYIVDIPKPDYTGLKLSASEAQTTGDPRLRKIFRLSTEEKDSPASPKESPKVVTSMNTQRVDPRRKKMEDLSKPPPQDISMTYAQQLNMLQASPFYQSLTSNQKLMLNQELASRNDQSGQSDPIISAMLQNLGLIPPLGPNLPGVQSQQALNILANVNNLPFQPPPIHQMPPPQNMGQGLLGPAPPGLQNLPPDFPMNFDPRNGGILGNGPPPFGNFQNDSNNFGGGGFNDDFYPDQGGNFNGNNGNNNRDNNRGFRDRPRRGRQNSNRNNRNFFRRHNNRNRNSPP